MKQTPKVVGKEAQQNMPARLHSKENRSVLQPLSSEPAKGATGSVERERAESLAAVEKMWAEAAGVKDGKLGHFLIGQMLALEVWRLSEDRVERVMNAAAALREMRPANVMEALLAVQMFGVHHAALSFLARANSTGQTFEGTDANVVRATRLMRLFTEQVATMAKLKGKQGQQKVTVRHVDVHSGGQAMVGVMESGSGGDQSAG